jgi:protease I
VLAEGYHEREFWYPYNRFKEAGAEVLVAGPAPGIVHGEGVGGERGSLAEITYSVEEILDDEIDLLYLPGGLRASKILREHEPTLQLTQRLLNSNTLVGAVGYASRILLSALQVKGRSIACPLDMAMEIVDARGYYVAEAAVRDRNLVTAVSFGNLPEQFGLLIPLAQARLSGDPE